MEPESLVDSSNELAAEDPDAGADALNRDRPNLLGLGLRVAAQAGGGGVEKHLEWIDAGGVRRHRHNRDHPAAEPFGCGVRPVVAHDDCRSPLVRLGTSRGIEIDQADLAATHQPSPSSVVDSHSWPSSLSD